MENLCKDIRSIVNSVHDGFYDGHFRHIFPSYRLERTLTPEEMLRLIARIQATIHHRDRVDLNGYIVAVQELRNDERAKQLTTIPPIPAQCTISAEPAQIPAAYCPTHSEASLFKDKPIASIKQKIPVSETDKKLLDGWLDANATTVWKWVNPDKPVPAGDIAAHCRGEPTNAYLLSHNKMDLFDIAKRTFGYGEGTWVKLMGNGDLDTLKWLIQDGCHLPPRALFRIAAANNHMHILQYLADTYGMDDATDVITRGVNAGHLKVLKWALLNGLTSDQIIMNASSNGHHNITIWMKSVGLA